MSSACKIVTCDTTPNRGFTGPTGAPGGGTFDGPTMLLPFSGTVGGNPATYPFADEATGTDSAGFEYPLGEDGLTLRTVAVQLHSTPDVGATYTASVTNSGNPVTLTTPITFTSADAPGTVKFSTFTGGGDVAQGESIGFQITMSGSTETTPVDFTATLSLGPTP